MRFIVILLIGLWSTGLSAQFIRDYETEKSADTFLGEAWYDNPSLRVSVLGLGNILNGGFGIVYEYPFHKYWSAEIEAGPIFHSVRPNFKGEFHRGIRSRISVKHFLGRYETDNYYVKFLYKFNYAFTRTNVALLDPSATFRETRIVEGTTYTHGGLIYLGYAMSFASRPRWIVDIAIGGGYFERVINDDIPAGFSAGDGGDGPLSRSGSGTSIDLSGTVQIGFHFFKVKE